MQKNMYIVLMYVHVWRYQVVNLMIIIIALN